MGLGGFTVYWNAGRYLLQNETVSEHHRRQMSQRMAEFSPSPDATTMNASEDNLEIFTEQGAKKPTDPGYGRHMVNRAEIRELAYRLDLLIVGASVSGAIYVRI